MERDIRLTATETNGKTITYNMVDIDLEEARNIYQQLQEFLQTGGDIGAISFTVRDRNHEVHVVHAFEMFVDYQNEDRVKGYGETSEFGK